MESESRQFKISSHWHCKEPRTIKLVLSYHYHGSPHQAKTIDMCKKNLGTYQNCGWQNDVLCMCSDRRRGEHGCSGSPPDSVMQQGRILVMMDRKEPIIARFAVCQRISTQNRSAGHNFLLDDEPT